MALMMVTNWEQLLVSHLVQLTEIPREMSLVCLLDFLMAMQMAEMKENDLELLTEMSLVHLMEKN